MRQEGSAIEDREVVDMRLLALLREMERGPRTEENGGHAGGGPQDAGRRSGRGRAVPAHEEGAGQGSSIGLGLSGRRAAGPQRQAGGAIDGRGGAQSRGWQRRCAGVLAGIEGVVKTLRRDDGLGGGPGQVGVEGDGAGTSVQSGQPPVRARVRRDYPDLATLELADDDEEVFGDAWPLIVEWAGNPEGAPQRRRGPRMADRARASAGGRAGAARRARHDAAAGEAAAARPGTGAGRPAGAGTALFDTRRERRKAELLNRVTFGLLWR